MYSSVARKHDVDVESGVSDGFDYATVMEGHVRRGFLRKVYGLLSCMLFFTFSTVALLSLVDNVRLFIQQNPYILGFSIAVYIGTAVALTLCGEGVRRSFPTNYLLLGLFTLATSLMVGVAASIYAPDSVALVSALTLGIFMGLTLFASQTKFDLTVFNMGLFTSVWGIILFGVTCILFTGSFLRNVLCVH